MGMILSTSSGARPATSIASSAVTSRPIFPYREFPAAGGLMSYGPSLADAYRQQGIYAHLIITLAARHRLPTVYPLRLFVTDGGLISYGPDTIEPYRRAAATLIAFSRARNRAS